MSQTNGEVLVLYFTEGKILDEAVIAQVGTELDSAVARAEHGQLLLNFKDVKFMSSSVLGKLVSLYKKCKANKITLKFCEIKPEIMEIFKITNLHRIFDIQTDEASALASFGKKKWFFQ
jgi:anti-sigma B factor antagonist